MAAAARVHRGDKLEPRGIGQVMVGARDRGAAGLDRLAQGFERRALELRY